ncbi:hypothetical protein Tco_0096783 [Tanacetum coccineum]
MAQYQVVVDCQRSFLSCLDFLITSSLLLGEFIAPSFLLSSLLLDRLRMVYTRDEGQELFTSHAMSDTEMGLDVADTLCFQLGGVRRRMTWRQFILALGLHTDEEMAEAGTSWGRLPIMFSSKTLSMDWGTANVMYLLAQYMFRHAEGRKSGARLSRGHFIGCLASHFRLISDQGLRAGAPRAAEDALAVDEGAQADLAPVQTPHPPPPAPKTMTQWITRLEEEVHELRWSIVGLRGDVDRSITD